MENDKSKLPPIPSTGDPQIDQIIKELTNKSTETQGFWKILSSFIGVGVGIVLGYFFFGKPKDKEITSLTQQLENLKKKNQRLKAKLKGEVFSSSPLLTTKIQKL